MKMEYLDATGEGRYPKASPKYLIRLSEFTDEEQLALIDQIEDTILKKQQHLRLHELPFVHSINCSLTLEISLENEGLMKTDGVNAYTCALTSSGYFEMTEIIKNVGEGHNWMTPGEYLDEPAFLLSKFGTW